jgi:hypothetical protein
MRAPLSPVDRAVSMISSNRFYILTIYYMSGRTRCSWMTSGIACLPSCTCKTTFLDIF